MQVVRKSIKCPSREEYYKLHLNIINPLLPDKLTEKEIMILASFMSIDEKLVEDDRFNSLVRKKVMEKHKLSAGGLSNHLKSLIQKGILKRSDVTGRIKINDFVLPGTNMQGYQFRIGYAIEQVHTGKTDEIGKSIPKIVKREEVITKEQEDEEEYEEEEEESLMPSANEIAAALHNNFDEVEDIIDEEEENEKPYKMSD